jgi:hypothetical protein
MGVCDGGTEGERAKIDEQTTRGREGQREVEREGGRERLSRAHSPTQRPVTGGRV